MCEISATKQNTTQGKSCVYFSTWGKSKSYSKYLGFYKCCLFYGIISLKIGDECCNRNHPINDFFTYMRSISCQYHNCQAYPGYFWAVHWKSMSLPEISRMTWQPCSTVSADVPYHASALAWTSYQIRKIVGCACAGNAGNVFPCCRLQRKLLVSDPGMHHGTCITHVPWCMWDRLPAVAGKTFPAFPAHPQFYVSGKRPIYSDVGICYKCLDNEYINESSGWNSIVYRVFSWINLTCFVLVTLVIIPCDQLSASSLSSIS